MAETEILTKVVQELKNQEGMKHDLMKEKI